MRAFIKEDKWKEFKELTNKYGFYIDTKKPSKYYAKPIDEDIILWVDKKTRELHLITPMGESPFMEVHTQFYKDLFDEGYIEFMEGRFDWCDKGRAGKGKGVKKVDLYQKWDYKGSQEGIKTI